MMGFGSMMLFGGLVSIVFLVLVIDGAVWLVVALARGASTGTQPPLSGTLITGQTPLDIVKARYAKGEITKEQFDEMKRDLGA